MDPISAAIIGTTMVAAGGMSVAGAQASNKAQRGFTREMWHKNVNLENTAVQRRAQDLRDAGMNPLLSASGGMAAGTPTVSSTRFENEGKAFADQINPTAILDIQRARADISKTKAETLTSLATAKNLGVQNSVLQAQAKKLLVDMGYTKIQAAKILSENSGTVTQTYDHGTGKVLGSFYDIHSKKVATRPVDYPENALSRLPDDFWTNPNASLSKSGYERKSFQNK